MANNESITKVEQNDLRKIIMQAQALIEDNSELIKGEISFYIIDGCLCVYRSMWGLRTLKHITAICEKLELTYLIETNERIIIFKNN